MMKRNNGTNIFLLSVSLWLLGSSHLWAQPSGAAWQDTSRSRRERIVALIRALTLQEKARLLMPHRGVERLGVPGLEFVEALHGLARRGLATVFPQAIGLAATFDDSLVYRVACAISDEIRAKHNLAPDIGNRIGLLVLSSVVNLLRDPRWGRGQETYGEDPYLTSRLGAAFVRGLQGHHPRYLKVAACAKHYVAHSGPEPGRSTLDARPPRRDLFNSYLPAFRALVQEAGVATVMATYNKVNGVPLCAHRYLLTEVLRGQFGFRSAIYSDGGALRHMHTVQGYTFSPEETCARALRAGLDVNLGNTFEALPEAVRRGLVSEALVDSALYRMLRVEFALGLFDPPGSTPWDTLGREVIHSPEHVALARQAARESIVLLKNDGVLPLDKNIRRLYVLGNQALSGNALLGNYYGLSDQFVSVLEGVMSKVHPGTIVEYRPGVRLDVPSKSDADWTDVSHRFDAIIAVMGIDNRVEGEEGSAIASATGGDRLNLHLPQNQIDYLKKQRSYGDKPIILVLFGGSPIIGEEIYELADAVLFVWYPGEQGGNAVADLIFGDASPSGKLPVTFPRSEADLPPFEDYRMAGRTYRYLRREPLFPFGFGLSYSRFELSRLRLGSSALTTSFDSLQIRFELRNRGPLDATEVVQLYLRYLDGTGPDEPNFTLRRFRRVCLRAGEKTEIRFTLRPSDFAIYDDEGHPVVRPGRYRIIVADAAPFKRSLELGAIPPLTAEVRLQSTEEHRK